MTRASTGSATDTARDAAGTARPAGGEVAGHATEQANNVAGAATGKAQDVAAHVTEQVNQVTGTAPDQVRYLLGQTHARLTEEAVTQNEKTLTGLRSLGDELQGAMTRPTGGRPTIWSRAPC